MGDSLEYTQADETKKRRKHRTSGSLIIVLYQGIIPRRKDNLVAY